MNGQATQRVVMIAFGQVPIGARFEFRGKRYEKVSEEFGRDEERNGNLFHRRTEVIPMRIAESGVRNGKGLLTPGEVRSSEFRVQSSGKIHLTQPSPPAETGTKRTRPEGWWLPKPEDRYELGEHDEAVRKAAELSYWRRPARRAGRLGREPDRELRAYGTL